MVEERPDLVGFSIKSFSVNNALALASKIKKSVSAKLIAGGPHITLCALDFFTKDNNGVFDFGFQGEGDRSFPVFCDEFENKDKYKEIIGLVYKNNEGKWQFNKGEFVDNLDDITRPDFRYFVGEIDFEKAGRISASNQSGVSLPMHILLGV